LLSQRWLKFNQINITFIFRLGLQECIVIHGHILAMYSTVLHCIAIYGDDDDDDDDDDSIPKIDWKRYCQRGDLLEYARLVI